MPPIDPLTLLRGAEAARTRPEQSAAAIAQALAAAPGVLEVHLAAYRFHFYNHDYAAAAIQARALLSLVARRLNIAQDWAEVAPGDADFTAHEAAPGLYLQALVGLGYCAARQGEAALARSVLTKAAALDPTDRFGGAWLLARIEAGEAEAEL